MRARCIGVMGGMFDPVHRGHVAVALTALQRLELDELRLIPCHLPNHRGPASASADERLAMLYLAVQVDSRLYVDDRECVRPGVSYTVETLESLRAEFPDAVLILVMGADAFAGLQHWHRWRDIFALAHVAVMSRPGSKQLEPVAMDAGLAEEWRQRVVDSPLELQALRHGRVMAITDLQMDISSTQVREALRSGSSADELLPEKVAEYIAARKLYCNAVVSTAGDAIR